MRIPLFFTLILLSALSARAQVLRVAGSSTLVQPFVNVAPALKELGVELKITGESNSPTAIAGVGANACDVAVSTRSLNPAERAAFPDRPMAETTIGYQALYLSVSNDVWAAGVHSITKADMRRIYEGTVRNWKVLGGPDRRIRFYNPPQGKGVWEFFVTWLYGDMREAPTGANFEPAGSAEETHNAVEFNGGSLGLLPPSRGDEKGAHALGIREEDGQVITATPDNVRKGTYPIRRPVIGVTAYRPSGAHKVVLDYLLSASGQAMVKRADMVAVTEEATE